MILYPNFGRKRQKAAWQTWSVFPDVFSVFAKLSMYPLSICDEDAEMLRMIVMICMTGQAVPQTLIVSI